jgi:hypothetical protein
MYWPTIREAKVESFDPLINWWLENFIILFKGPSSQDQQKTIERRLNTSSMTLTGQSHFML